MTSHQSSAVQKLILQSMFSGDVAKAMGWFSYQLSYKEMHKNVVQDRDPRSTTTSKRPLKHLLHRHGLGPRTGRQSSSRTSTSSARRCSATPPGGPCTGGHPRTCSSSSVGNLSIRSVHGSASPVLITYNKLFKNASTSLGVVIVF
jgi:hypothetical protein